jgi:beta-N-acetylhexosaminidase
VSDSHTALPRLDLSLASVERDHLPPFRAAMAAGAAAMMTAHIVIPELGEAPATLNPAAGDLLRSMGFDGLLVTDALDMAAVRATVGSGSGAVQALLAGADLLCVGNPDNSYSGGGTDEGAYLEVRDAVLAAVSDGSLPIEVLRRAAGRVAFFTSRARTAGSIREPSAASGWTGPDWTAVARRACDIVEVAGNARLPAGTTAVAFLDARVKANLAAGSARNFFAAELSPEIAVHPVTLDDLSGDGEPTSPEAPVWVVLVDSLADPRQRDALEAVGRAIPTAICINAGLGVEALALDARPPLTTINCYGASRVTARAVAALLTGR